MLLVVVVVLVLVLVLLVLFVVSGVVADIETGFWRHTNVYGD